MNRLLLAACFFVGTALVCRAEQPECTGDRHYDGVACCPYVGDTTTTTTTLGPRVECPDPAPCPTVECQCGEGTTVNNITVNRCPSAPVYTLCGIRKHGAARATDRVVNGVIYKCKPPTTHRQFLVPLL